MIVNGSQSQLYHDIHLVFQGAQPLAEPMAVAQMVDSGHGRLEQRRLSTRPALLAYGDWPGLGQVFQLERCVSLKKSGEQRHDVVYGVTSGLV